MSEHGDQGELLPAAVGALGENQAAARRTVTAAGLEEIDAAAAQALVTAADMLDRARHGKPYGFAEVLNSYRELLVEMKLTPASRGGGTGDDPFEKLLEQLAGDGTSPTPGNAPH